ncbi:MAG: amino acid ABC transporter permease [Firmicutes bacterium]|nr:amino acid ABC transporter permease [Bacillota bacterium]
MEMYLKGILIALKGAPVTIFVSLVAVLIGAIVGLFIALMKKSDNKLLSNLSKIYIEVVRGTPMLVQALIMAYGIPMILQSNGIMFKWPHLIIPALLVCGLNSAAYMAEVIRGGIQAIDPGQIEAAKSLGMSKGQINKLIVLPQAFKIVIPSLGNEFVTLIKETSVLSYVGIEETLRKAALFNAATYCTFEAYIGAAIVYLMMTYPLSKAVQALEKKLAKEA